MLSDDQGTIDPVRFYTVGIDLSDGFSAGDVEVLDVTTLRDAGGQPFAPASLDPEGLTLDRRNDRLVITSEGIANAGIAPFVRTFDLAGQQLGELPLPAAFVPGPGHGVRQNLGFESAAVTPNGQFLLVGAENALAQDGPPATVTGGSPARIIRYRLTRDSLDRQVVYWTDPIAESSGAGDCVCRQWARRDAPAVDQLDAHDGALVLRRCARHRQHDPAVRGEHGGRR